MSNGEEINESVLLAYLNKELSHEDMIKVDLWLTRSSANMQKFNKVREAWKLAGRVKSIPVVVDTDKAWNKVVQKIDTSRGQVVQMKPKSSRIYVMIAASVAILIGAMTVMVFMNDQHVENPGMLELTAQNSVINGNLNDGSNVTLNENSVLAYPPQFDETERRVSLKGECFFEIARDESKPFIVDLPNEGYVKVLGTSFNIKATEGADQFEVYVSTGKVEFGSNNNIVLLSAGEKGLMDSKTGFIEKVEAEVYEAAETFWMDQTLDFNGETMTEVVEILNQVYGDKVVLECEALKNKRVNSKHPNESLESVLITLSELYHFESHPEKSESATVYLLKCNE